MVEEFNGTVVCSLCLLRRPGQVLLARKMQKLVSGKWNGYGGRQELGESIRMTACRETLEESGEGIVIFPANLRRRAVVYFHNQPAVGQELFTVKVHVYEVFRWLGQEMSSAEMSTPTWFPIGNLPWALMPVGDPYWLPQVLDGKNLVGHIYYGPKQEFLTSTPEIRIVDDLDSIEPED
jgi:ADP-ribose pyrophosphatase YjhB (NUDIX family)